MHVPGVKQEQPSRRPPLREPLTVDMTIRDSNHVKIVRVDEKRPEDVVRILNSILQKMDSKQRVVIVNEGDSKKSSNREQQNQETEVENLSESGIEPHCAGMGA
jgi:hypothetical protein